MGAHIPALGISRTTPNTLEQRGTIAGCRRQRGASFSISLVAAVVKVQRHDVYVWCPTVLVPGTDRIGWARGTLVTGGVPVVSGQVGFGERVLPVVVGTEGLNVGTVAGCR